MKKICILWGLILFLACQRAQDQQDGIVLLMPQSVQECLENPIKQFAQADSLHITQHYAANTGSLVSQLYLEKIKPKTDIAAFVSATQSREVEKLYPIVRKEHLDTGYLTVVTQEGYQVDSILDLINIADKFAWVNPASSSAGRDFLLWTYHVLDSATWEDFWTQVRQKSKIFTSSWSEAFRMLAQKQAVGMVTYHTDQAYNVYHKTGLTFKIHALKEGWIKQDEYALLLRDSEEGQKCMDFLISSQVQSLLPLGTWTIPAHHRGLEYPSIFEEHVPPLGVDVPIFDPSTYSPEEAEQILTKWQLIWSQAS